MPLSVGDKLGPYEIIAFIGAGGMGEVYKARDTRLDRIVAIKQLKGKHTARFEQEARALAALNHPHVCHIYDAGHDYLVMEYVEGKPLSGPLPNRRPTGVFAHRLQEIGCGNEEHIWIALVERHFVAIECGLEFRIEYGNIGESVLSAESTTKARQLRDRASDREKFFIDFLYDRQVTGNLDKACHTLELWLQTYPRGDEPPSPHDLLGGIAAQAIGRFERAMDISQKFIATHPDVVLGYGNLASVYFFLDRFPEAESTLQRASERKLEVPRLWVMRYNIAVLKGDKDEMGRTVGLAKESAGPSTGWPMRKLSLWLVPAAGRIRSTRQTGAFRAVESFPSRAV